MSIKSLLTAGILVVQPVALAQEASNQLPEFPSKEIFCQTNLALLFTYEEGLAIDSYQRESGVSLEEALEHFGYRQDPISPKGLRDTSDIMQMRDQWSNEWRNITEEDLYNHCDRKGIV